jgi:hypothetical protein
MLLLVVCATVALLTGISLVFFPKALKKLNDDFNKPAHKLAVSFDELVWRSRQGIGVSCILVSLLCFFVVYYIIRKHG